MLFFFSEFLSRDKGNSVQNFHPLNCYGPTSFLSELRKGGCFDQRLFSKLSSRAFRDFRGFRGSSKYLKALSAPKL